MFGSVSPRVALVMVQQCSITSERQNFATQMLTYYRNMQYFFNDHEQQQQHGILCSPFVGQPAD
jgi:hypothetical protein